MVHRQGGTDRTAETIWKASQGLSKSGQAIAPELQITIVDREKARKQAENQQDKEAQEDDDEHDELGINTAGDPLLRLEPRPVDGRNDMA